MVIDELEGRAPQRVIADVELTCEEEFMLEDGEGRVMHNPDACLRKVRSANFCVLNFSRSCAYISVVILRLRIGFLLLERYALGWPCAVLLFIFHMLLWCRSSRETKMLADSRRLMHQHKLAGPVAGGGCRIRHDFLLFVRPFPSGWWWFPGDTLQIFLVV